ncbi:MAG: hypothetical protein C4542_03005 [Dehalococcoidia bacterium]|nr:MAG: hypothetical protein C4542_03005 [Dehalococcoidia bacterium]
MKWDETVAFSCRYGSEAATAFPNAEIIWEHSEADYQGFANILGRLSDGRFFHYEWTYGSCSGCDEWESAGYGDDEIVKMMQEAAVYFDDINVLSRYLQLDEATTRDMHYPTANSPMNGSVPGMLRFLGGGIGNDFKDMGEAFVQWQKEAPTVDTE